MKWLVKKLADLFNVSIERTVEKVVEKEVVKTIYEPKDGVIEGDVTIKGNLLVTGTLSVQGEVTCYKSNKEVTYE